MKINLHSHDKSATKLSLSLHHDKRYYNSVTHTDISTDLQCQIRTEAKYFSSFRSKESELIHVKHSTIEQNLLQVTTC